MLEAVLPLSQKWLYLDLDVQIYHYHSQYIELSSLDLAHSISFFHKHYRNFCLIETYGRLSCITFSKYSFVSIILNF